MADANPDPGAVDVLMEDPFVDENTERTAGPTPDALPNALSERLTARDESESAMLHELLDKTIEPVLQLFRDGKNDQGFSLWEEGKKRQLVQDLKNRMKAARAEGSLPTSDDQIDDDKPVTRRDLKEALQQAMKGSQQQRGSDATWAKVAAGAWQGPTAKALPQRRNKEVVIRAGEEQEPAMKERKPIAIVTAVNVALPGAKAIAARKLPSGDVVVTFDEKLPEGVEGEGWVTKAFGNAAKLQRREIAVIAKGISLTRIKEIHEDNALLTTLRQACPELNRCKKMIPKNPSARFGSVLLHVSTPAAAQKLCNDGLLWEAQIFNCEPFASDVRVKQCFGCFSYGHIAAHCQKGARCGCCGSSKHPEGEDACPVKTQGAAPKCANCGGKHRAWEKACPIGRDMMERAKAAYAVRPRRFQTTEEAATTAQKANAVPLTRLSAFDMMDKSGSPTKKRRVRQQSFTMSQPTQPSLPLV